MIPITKNESGRECAKKKSIDNELVMVMRRLKKIQEEIGGGRHPSSFAEESLESEPLRKKHGDPFSELREDVMKNLAEIRPMMGPGEDFETPREKIQRENEVRNRLGELEYQMKALDGILQTEASNQTSSLSEDEILEQESTVAALLNEINQLKTAHRTGTAPPSSSLLSSPSSARHFQGKLTLVDGYGSSSSDLEQQEISEDQQQRLDTIRSRSADFDHEVEEIGDGIDALAEIAQAQNSQVKKQNALISDLQENVDQVQYHLENVNAKMKSTLDKVTRSGGKMFIDLFCLVILVGLCVILYQLAES